MHDVIASPTRGTAHLDKFLVSDSFGFKYQIAIDVGPPLSSSDHCSVVVTYSSDRQIEDKQIKWVKVQDFRKSHLEEFCNRVSVADFSSLYLSEDVNEMCTIFYRIIEEAVSRSIPCEYVTFTSRDKPWITPVLKSLINRRWKAYRERNMSLYNHYKTKVKLEIDKAKSSWAQKAANSAKQLWNIVRELNGNRRNDQSLEGKSNFGLDSSSKLDDVARVLQTNYNKNGGLRTGLKNLRNQEAPRAPFVSVDVRMVFSLLKKVKTNKSAGSDGIHPLLLQAGASVLAKPLAHLFETSLSLGVVPEKWKLSDIILLPKCPKPSINDFRPISLLPIAAKILEIVVFLKEKTNIMSTYDADQFAYRRLGSTTAALVSIHDTVTRMLEDSDCWAVQMTTLDLTKAFDKVPHDALICHLDGKVSDTFLLWLMDYLSNRQFRVKHSRYYSSTFDVLSGVPQGSVIGPYLFASFVSPLQPASCRSKYIKYADDVTILQPRTLPMDGGYDDGELTHAKQWITSKGLVLNDKKTRRIFFGKRNVMSTGCKLPCDHAVKILGVNWSCDLRWNQHVERVIRTCSSRLYLLRRLKPILSKSDLIIVYQAVIVSVLLYAAPLFVGLSVTLSEGLEIIRKRAHRIVCGCFCECGMFPRIEDLRQAQSLKLLCHAELDTSHPLHRLVPDRLPRSDALLMPFVRTSRRLASFIPQTCFLANTRK